MALLGWLEEPRHEKIQVLSLAPDIPTHDVERFNPTDNRDVPPNVRVKAIRGPGKKTRADSASFSRRLRRLEAHGPTRIMCQPFRQRRCGALPTSLQLRTSIAARIPLWDVRSFKSAFRRPKSRR